MKKVLIIFLFSVSIALSYNPDSAYKQAIVPIIKVEQIKGRESWILKYPVGTAFLVMDSINNYKRFYLVTARHVIENDEATICLLNFAEKNNPGISSGVRKYVIKKNEWRYHPLDTLKNKQAIFYTGYDIAIAEIFPFRFEQGSEILWNRAININLFASEANIKRGIALVVAFPFVNRFSMEKGLTFGDLEIDSGMNDNRIINELTFDKNRIVKNLNEILILNPKFRRGYSGGLVFSVVNNKPLIIGMAMGMTDIRSYGNDKFCYAFFVRSEYILNTIKYHFNR